MRLRDKASGFWAGKGPRLVIDDEATDFPDLHAVARWTKRFGRTGFIGTLEAVYSAEEQAAIDSHRKGVS